MGKYWNMPDSKVSARSRVADEQELGTESLHFRKAPLLQPWMF